MSENSIREALEGAFEQETDENIPQPVQNEAPAPEESAPVDQTSPAQPEDKPVRDYVRDELGKFAPKDAEPAVKAEKPPTEGIKPGPKVGEPAPPAAPRAPEDEPLRMSTEKAPVGWKPEARETWSSIPQLAREEIMRQTQLVHDTLNRTKEQRKFAETVQQVVAPYRALIESEGTDVVKAIDGMLKTAQALRTAPPAHKAQLVAQLVREYGIDVNTLDRALVGAAPPPVDPAVAQVKQQFERELAPLRQMQQQLIAQQQQAEMERRAAADSAIAQFEATQPEFLNDVAQDMAQILELGAQRGVDYTLEQAYELACRAHPEISRVLQQREQAKVAQNLTSTAQRAKQAAVSVGGAPSLGGQDSTPNSVREALMLAMGQAER